MLTLRGVRAGYPRRPVLDALDLDANTGELLSVIGCNGAGKTTLLRAIAKLHPIAAGTMAWHGESTKPWRRSQTAQHFAYMPQAPTDDWPLTVREYVTLGRLPHLGWRPYLTAVDRASVEEAMKSTTTLTFAERILPELSGGERQRVRLARALAQTPMLLLLDEPTAQLDLRYQRDVLDTVRRLTRELHVTAVVTIHDINLAAAFADRLAILHDGRITRLGTPDEVLASPELEAAYGIPLTYTLHPTLGIPWIVPKP